MDSKLFLLPGSGASSFLIFVNKIRKFRWSGCGWSLLRLHHHPSAPHLSLIVSVLLILDSITSCFCYMLNFVLEESLAGQVESGPIHPQAEFAKPLPFLPLFSDWPLCFPVRVARLLLVLLFSFPSAVPLPPSTCSQTDYNVTQVLRLSVVPLWHFEGHGNIFLPSFVADVVYVISAVLS